MAEFINYAKHKMSALIVHWGREVLLGLVYYIYVLVCSANPLS